MDLFLKSSLFRDGFSVDVVSYYYTHGTARSIHKPPMIHITCTLSLTCFVLDPYSELCSSLFFI